MKTLCRILIFTVSFFSVHSIGQTLTSSNATNEGGALQLINPLKTANNIANNWTLYNMTGAYGNSLQFWNYGNGGFYGSRFTILDNGRVGIGTSTPIAQLSVNGDGHFKAVDDRSGMGVITIETINGTNLKFGGNTTYSWIQSHNSKPLYINELGNNTIFNLVGGNVGIGTTSPSHKLDVIGTIRSREVKVDMNGADFVFEEKYSLMPLTELEAYVKKNKHLPEIATAKEMQEQGSNLGDLNSKLLQKIEELTLYVIEQQKLITQQAKELESHKVMLAKIDQMEKTLAKMNTANEK